VLDGQATAGDQADCCLPIEPVDVEAPIATAAPATR
jgi:hypothetical protein